MARGWELNWIKLNLNWIKYERLISRLWQNIKDSRYIRHQWKWWGILKMMVCAVLLSVSKNVFESQNAGFYRGITSMALPLVIRFEPMVFYWKNDIPTVGPQWIVITFDESYVSPPIWTWWISPSESCEKLYKICVPNWNCFIDLWSNDTAKALITLGVDGSWNSLGLLSQYFIGSCDLSAPPGCCALP